MKGNLTIALVATMFLLASCEKVIDIKLNDAAAKYVVEGNISNLGEPPTVHITQTKNFSDNNDFPGVSGAIVTLSDNGASAIVLPETTTGIYSSPIVTGTPGHIYSLDIKLAGQHFTATSTMPLQVNMDSLFIEDRLIFGDSSKIVSVRYKDPVAKGNAYHFVQYRNGKQERTVFAVNDDYTNGNTVITQLLSFNNDDDNNKIKKGDLIKVEMQSIDTPVYQYWNSIEAATGESNNATPANPVTNISGGALGYFSAHTSQSRSITVP